jgi:deoxyribose-phosphate aldolase
MTKKEIASYIDQTVLAPDAGVKEITQVCNEAIQYGFASVCVNPVYVPYAATALEKTPVKVCTVVGFPLGASTSKVKADEARNAVLNGADEVDMVINIGAAKDGRFSIVGSDIATVVKAAKSAGKRTRKKIIVKVIIETCLLEDSAIKMCCMCAKKAGADFVKTSTGFANPKGIDGMPLPNGASESHVKLMRKTVGDDMGVKASGGIRSARTLITMLEAGASRIGTSSGANIYENWDESKVVHNKY